MSNKEDNSQPGSSKMSFLDIPEKVNRLKENKFCDQTFNSGCQYSNLFFDYIYSDRFVK